MGKLFVTSFVLLVFIAGFSRPTTAETYPDRPIRIIVSASAGGILDIYARTIGDSVSKSLGQPVIIDNRPGANGVTAATAAARAKPDGYTLLFTAAAVLSVNPSLFPDLPYDSNRDFSPISLVVRGYPILVVNPKVPAKTFAEFIEYAKAHPGRVTYGSPAIGSGQHIAGELLEELTGIQMLHVPYKNHPQALSDLIGGQIDAVLDFPSMVIPHIKSGGLRALAIAGPRRMPALPDVPTAEELGLPDLNLPSWNGVLAPAGTPQDIIAILNRAVRAAMTNPKYLERVAAASADSIPSTPEEFSSYIKSEHARWSKIIKAADVKVE